MTSLVRAIIIDDEPGAIETLHGMLSTFCPQIKVVASVSSVEDALIALQQHNPDLIFLDIELPPYGNGFDLLKAVPDHRFKVVFTTAYAEYAVKAINEIQPMGYLVKPYRVSDLVQIMRLAAAAIESEASTPNDTLSANLGIIIPDSRKGKIILRTQQILYCKADSGTTDIFILRSPEYVEKITASRSLKDLESELPGALFCRTHHGFIVGLQHVLRYQRTGRNGVIFLPQNHKVTISVARIEYFEQSFAQFLKGKG